LIKKFPTAWEKISENRRGNFFDSHCTKRVPDLNEENIPSAKELLITGISYQTM